MEEIVKTTLLEHEKSSFLLDLIKHNNNLYINIKQTIHADSANPVPTEIKINPAMLDELMEVLKFYSEQIPQQQKEKEKFLSAAKREEIQNRYLKGIAIKNLSLQFECRKELIEQVLRNKGIAIVDGNQLKPEWPENKVKKRR